MASAGGLYVSIIPVFEGGFQAIQGQLLGPAGDAGAQAGARLGQELVTSAASSGAEVGRSIASGVISETASAGSEIGQALTTEIVARSQEGGAAAGEALRAGLISGASTAGTEAGTAIRDGVTAGAEQGAAAARTALVAGGETAGTDAGTSAGSWFQRTFALSSTTAGQELVTSLREQLDTAATSASQAEYQLSAAMAAEEKAANAVTLAEQRLLETRVRYQDGSSQVIRAENQLSAAQNASSLASNKVALAEDNVTTAHKAQADAAKDLEDAQSATVFSTTSVEAAFNKLVPGAAALTGQIKTLGLMIGITLAGQMAVNGVKASTDFQEALTRLVTSAGESQANLQAVGNGILQMAGQVGYSAQDLATGLYTIESAGFHGADGLAVLKAAAQGAATEGADLGTVTNAVTDILNDYHLSAGQAATVTSQMITAVGEGKTTFQDLSAAMSTVSPTAASAGINIQNLLGVLAQMTSHGVSANEAAQQLASTIREFESPSSTMSAELGQIGLNASTLSQQLGTKGVAGTLQEVEQAILQNMGPAGTVLLNSFNESSQASEKAQEAFSGLGSGAQKVAQEFMSGQISGGFTAWSKAISGLTGPQANLLNQWKTLYDSSQGFSNALKTGGGDVQTFDQAMEKATGTSSALQVALLTTGANASSTNSDIANIGKATADAGNNVQGWAQVQQNFNQQLKEFQSAAGSLGITIGTALLPIIQRAMSFFSSFMQVLSQHTTAASIAAIAIGGLVSAFVGMFIVVQLVGTITTFIGVLKTFELASKLATAAQWLWNVALDANPIGLIIIAIAALVAGVIYAYTHFQAFRDIVNGAWDGIKSAAMAAWNDALKPALDGIVTGAQAVANFFVGAWRGIENAWNAVASAVSNAWRNAIEPVLNEISVVVRTVAAVILTILIAPVVIAWNLMAAAFRAEYNAVIQPTFNAIAVAAMWLYNNGIKPAINAIQVAWNALGTAAMWLYNNALHPAFQLIGDAWETQLRDMVTIWNVVLKPLFDAVWAAGSWLGTQLHNIFVAIGNWWLSMNTGISNIFNSVLKVCWDALEAAANWLYSNVLHPIFQAIGWLWENELRGMQVIWQDVLKPTFDAIGGAVNAVGQAFDTAVNWIQTVWNKLIEITKDPVNFVINTVYNHGILPTWNAIAGIFSLGQLKPVATLAEGGSLGGGSQWDAVGSGFLTNGPKAIVGEGNPRYPEYVIPTDPTYRDRAMGLYGALGQDIGMYASGGILGTIGNAVSNVAGSIGSTATNAFSWLSSIAGDVTGGVNQLFSTVIGSLTGMPTPDGSGGPFVTALKDMPQQVITAVINLVKGMFAGGGGGAGSPYTGAISGGVQQWAGLVLQALQMLGQPASWESTVLRRMNQESGGNPNAINLWDINAQEGHPSIGLMQVIQGTFDAYHVPGTSNNIYDPLANIAAGLNYALHRYGSLGALNQPGGYDSGGYLMPGVTPVYNGTGSPEPVFTSRQWDILRSNLQNGTNATGTGNTINVYANNQRSGVSIAHEVDRHLSRNSRLSLSF